MCCASLFMHSLGTKANFALLRCKSKEREHAYTHTQKKKETAYSAVCVASFLPSPTTTTTTKSPPSFFSSPSSFFFFIIVFFIFMRRSSFFFLSLLFCLLSRELFKSTLLFFFRVFHTFELPVSSPLFFFVSISQHFFVWRSGLRFLHAHAHAHTHTQTQTHKGEDSTDQGKTPSFPSPSKKKT